MTRIPDIRIIWIERADIAQRRLDLRRLERDNLRRRFDTIWHIPFGIADKQSVVSLFFKLGDEGLDAARIGRKSGLVRATNVGTPI